VVIPLREKGKVTGIGVHSGLWTSQALTWPAEEVPLSAPR
jgi:glutamate dehydrogenase